MEQRKRHSGRAKCSIEHQGVPGVIRFASGNVGGAAVQPGRTGRWAYAASMAAPRRLVRQLVYAPRRLVRQLVYARRICGADVRVPVQFRGDRSTSIHRSPAWHLASTWPSLLPSSASTIRTGTAMTSHRAQTTRAPSIGSPPAGERAAVAVGPKLPEHVPPPRPAPWHGHVRPYWNDRSVLDILAAMAKYRAVSVPRPVTRDTPYRASTISLVVVQVTPDSRPTNHSGFGSQHLGGSGRAYLHPCR